MSCLCSSVVFPLLVYDTEVVRYTHSAVSLLVYLPFGPPQKVNGVCTPSFRCICVRRKAMFAIIHCTAHLRVGGHILKWGLRSLRLVSSPELSEVSMPVFVSSTSIFVFPHRTPWAGVGRFEPTVSAGERPQTYALERAATGTSNACSSSTKYYCKDEIKSSDAKSKPGW